MYEYNSPVTLRKGRSRKKLKIHTEIRVQKTSEIEQTCAAPTSCEAEHKDDKLAGINVHCTLYTVQYIYDANDKTFRHLGYIYR
jgi:hypothetical protein